MLVPWFAYDYQISEGRVPPGVAVAQAMHNHYKDKEDVIIVAYSSKKQTGIRELITRRNTGVAFAACGEFHSEYRMHSENSSYSYGVVMIDRNGKIALQKTDYNSTEGGGKGDAKKYFKAIDHLRDQKRVAGVPEITPPEVNSVEERALRLVAKSLGNGVIGSNYKKINDFLNKNPGHAEAESLKATIDNWVKNSEQCWPDSKPKVPCTKRRI